MIVDEQSVNEKEYASFLMYWIWRSWSGGQGFTFWGASSVDNAKAQIKQSMREGLFIAKPGKTDDDGLSFVPPHMILEAGFEPNTKKGNQYLTMLQDSVEDI